MEKREAIFLVLASVFITSLIIANLVGITKIVVFMGLSIPIGMLPYPVTFLATDLISEIYGKKRASFLVWVGLLMNVFMLAVVTAGDLLPADAGWFDAVNAEGQPGKTSTFDYVYGYMVRGTIASMIAYLVAQFTDVHLFHFWKSLTGGKHLWLRNNASTLVSQLVDTAAVLGITFWGVMGIGQLGELILFGYLFKAMAALLDTPFFYLGVRYIRKTLGEEARADLR